MDEAKLIKGIRTRDETAFADAISCYSRLLWVIASTHLSKADGFSERDIEECVADVFFDLWKNSERYDPERGSLKSFLCTMASRKAISMYRRSVQAEIIFLEDIQKTEEPIVEEEGENEDYRELYEAISCLPEPNREIITRRYFFNEKPAAIAAKMKLPKKEIENRLYRAKKSLSYSLPDRYKEAL